MFMVAHKVQWFVMDYRAHIDNADCRRLSSLRFYKKIQETLADPAQAAAYSNVSATRKGPERVSAETYSTQARSNPGLGFVNVLI
jgi:hypothetical protein